MSSQQNAKQNYNKMKAKRSFEIVAQSKYLGRSVTNKI
jgi:ATP/ADP translocase